MHPSCLKVGETIKNDKGNKYDTEATCLQIDEFNKSIEIMIKEKLCYNEF
jgi:hypothetical protein